MNYKHNKLRIETMCRRIAHKNNLKLKRKVRSEIGDYGCYYDSKLIFYTETKGIVFTKRKNVIGVTLDDESYDTTGKASWVSLLDDGFLEQKKEVLQSLIKNNLITQQFERRLEDENHRHCWHKIGNKSECCKC